MSTVNYAYREILCKVVYYGPGVGGKTTNLQVVHGQVDQSARGDLVSLATETDRTLYFDFLGLDLGEIKGFKVRFQLYTVPGQVQYNATRKLVLQGVDGIVFVADSQNDRMEENLQSLQNLRENLIEYNLNLDEIPFVLQLNKRDLKNISSVEELSQKLKVGDCPVIEAVAVTGVGVKQTLKKILGMVLTRLHEQTVGQSQEAPVAGAERYTDDAEDGDNDMIGSPPVEEEPAPIEIIPMPAPPKPQAPPVKPIAPLPANQPASAAPPRPASARLKTDREKEQERARERPPRPEGSPLQMWLKELPSSSVRQRCDVYWNMTKIGSGSLEMKRKNAEEYTTTPMFTLSMSRRVLMMFSKEEEATIFASINSQRATGYGDFFVLVDKDLLGITGDVRYMRGWRVFLKKGETPFVFAVKKTFGGQFLLVPEGQREVSPE